MIVALTLLTAGWLPSGSVRRLGCKLSVRVPAIARHADHVSNPAEDLFERDWSAVSASIRDAVRGGALPGEDNEENCAVWESLHSSPPANASGRVTWRLTIAYYGPSFSGFSWQAAAPKPTVEGCLQSALRPLLDGKSELRISCAGRTDAGVSSTRQHVSFHSWPGLQANDLSSAIDRASPEPGALRLLRARQVGGSYHATYSTTWRRYVYLLPPRSQHMDDAREEARVLDALLGPLVGCPRDFAALGRSVPHGKNTTTLLRHASARVVQLRTGSAGGAPSAAIRIELVGDRFLRRQVRILVATAVAIANSDGPQVVGEAHSRSDGEPLDTRSLLRASTSRDPTQTAAESAPPVGLVLAGAGSDDQLRHAWLSEEEKALAEDSAAEDGVATNDALGLAMGVSAGDRRGTRSLGKQPQPATTLVPTAASAALQILEEQAECGAALDALLARAVRAYDLGQNARNDIHDYLDTVSRYHGRLASRLRALRVREEPRSRLLASLNLCHGLSDVDGLRAALGGSPLQPTEEEMGWLHALAPPVECAEMEQAERLECPQWAWPSFQRAFGAAGVETELRALQAAPPLDLRVNTLRASRTQALAEIRAAGLPAEPTPYSPVGIRLGTRAVALGRIPGLLHGVVEPQDEASQLVALLLGARPGEFVVDYCAGSGGKTLALAAEMRNKGKLLAMDISEPRLRSCVRRLAKAGVDNVERHVIDPGPKDTWLKRRKRSFDRVLVDAPCSGVGAWRRNPDARWLRKTRPLSDLLPIQGDVLRRAARLVRPGGTLVYATCSVLLEENDDQVESFLASEDGAEFDLAPPDQGRFPVPLEPGGYLRLTPARHGCDGLFGARLMRREGGWAGKRPRARRSSSSKGGGHRRCSTATSTRR